MTPKRGVRGIGVLLAAVSWGFGCQSFRSWEQACPGLYSGLRYYGDQIGELPYDGRIFFTLDLPLTSVADTLALPFTAFATPSKSAGGYPVGCRWAGD